MVSFEASDSSREDSSGIQKFVQFTDSGHVNTEIAEKHHLEIQNSAEKIEQVTKQFFTRLKSEVPVPAAPRELNMKMVEAWIAAQPESMRPAFRDLISKLERISFETFYDKFLNVVSYINEKIEKGEIDATYVVLLVEPSKSNEWLAELATPFLKILPQDVASLGKKGSAYIDYLASLEKAGKHFPGSVIFFDDGIYSGRQMSNFVKAVFESTEKFNQQRKIDGKEQIPLPRVTVACPYMTKMGVEKILRDNAPWIHNLDISPHEEIHSIAEKLDEKSISVLSKTIWKSDPRNSQGNFDKDYLSGPYSRGNIWFDHKVPNFMSFADAVEFGVVYDAQGNPVNGVFEEDKSGERIFRRTPGQAEYPILPDDPPPYKNPERKQPPLQE